MGTETIQDDLRTIFSANLVESLNVRGWSQGELARRLFGRCTTSDRVKISRWVTKINLPDAQTLKELAEVLGVSIDTLLVRK